jgi:hypothetical protein
MKEEKSFFLVVKLVYFFPKSIIFIIGIKTGKVREENTDSLTSSVHVYVCVCKQQKDFFFHVL